MFKSNFDLVHEKFVGCCIAVQHIYVRKNIRSHDVLSGLNSIKFLEILNSNKTSNTFSTYQIKITFKPLNFVRKSFLTCFKKRTLLGLKHLNFRIFSFILHRKYTQAMYINKKLYTSSRFARLRVVSKLSTFFLYTLYTEHIELLDNQSEGHNT